MQQVPRGLEVDVLIEHVGRQVQLSGSGIDFYGRFPTLFSLAHRARTHWKHRRLAPEGSRLEVAWTAILFPVKTGRREK